MTFDELQNTIESMQTNPISKQEHHNLIFKIYDAFGSLSYYIFDMALVKTDKGYQIYGNLDPFTIASLITGMH